MLPFFRKTLITAFQGSHYPICWFPTNTKSGALVALTTCFSKHARFPATPTLHVTTVRTPDHFFFTGQSRSVDQCNDGHAGGNQSADPSLLYVGAATAWKILCYSSPASVLENPQPQ